MKKINKNEHIKVEKIYRSDFKIHPCEVILKILENENIKFDSSTEYCGLLISEICKKSWKVDKDLAKRLSDTFGASEKFWFNLSNIFDKNGAS